MLKDPKLNRNNCGDQRELLSIFFYHQAVVIELPDSRASARPACFTSEINVVSPLCCKTSTRLPANTLCTNTVKATKAIIMCCYNRSFCSKSFVKTLAISIYL